MKKENGFTLFSLTITLAISSILTMLAGGVLNIGVKSYHQYVSRSVMLREAQNTMILLQNKIPMTVPANIIRANSRRFRFITVDGEDIDFRYNNKQGIFKYRIVGKKAWSTLMNNILKNSFTFSYSKIDGSSYHSTDEISRVSISFRLTIQNEEMNYENQFFIRN